MAVPPGPTPTKPYTERLSCPWWLWLPVVTLVAILALEIGLGAPGARTWVPVAVAVVLCLVGVWWLGRIRIRVTAQNLHVDDATLPREVIAEVIPLGDEDRRLLLGQAADPLAFVIQRPWIAGAVQIVLDDPQDPTPYWLISSRRPEALAAALLAPGRNAA
jgi:hypothetical protein